MVMYYIRDKIIKKQNRLVDRYKLKEMAISAIFLALCCGVVITFSSKLQRELPLNDRPIIGVLSQELSPILAEGSNGNYTSYIAASYVKFLEGAGARVVPIWINKDQAYYKNLLHSINGVLFPGGAIELDEPKGYAAAGAIIYDLAVEFNKNGDYFPLWGTCMGFELMTYLAAGQREHRCDCWSFKQSVPLEFEKDFQNSKLFGSAPELILKILSSQGVAANYHQYCVTAKNMTEFGLMKDWHILSTNHDLNGLEFVSSIESRLYPFYSSMFHPEKNGYEWRIDRNIPHSPDAILIMQYFANFFVTEARKSSHTFKTTKEEQDALIYNFPPSYTGKCLIFEQCYFFKD